MRARHIEVFYAVMQAGTVSAAAQRLRVSQPSVTKTLKQAEDMLGYPLFERFKGRLQPTDEARALLKEVTRAQAALEDVRELSQRLKHGGEGTLRVASTPSLGQQILPDAVAAYAAEHPRLRFELSTRHSGDLLQSLGRPAQGFDLGFTFGIEGGPPGLEAIELGTASFACLAPKSMLPKALSAVRCEDLAGRGVIGLDESEPLGRLVAENLRTRNLLIDTPIKAQTYRLACDLARRGAGLAIVDCYTAAGFLADEKAAADLRVLPFEPSLSLPVTAAYSVARGMPLAARRMISAFTVALEQAQQRAAALGLVVAQRA